MKSIALVIVAWTTLFIHEAAFAANNQVNAVLTTHKVVVKPDGAEILVAAHEIYPGDVFEYRVVYRNTDVKPAMNVVATLPVPPVGLEYVPDSGSPKATQASVDGKTFAPVPLTRVVTLPDGREETRAVPLSEYRFLRWSLGDLDPGVSHNVSARLRLVDSSAVATAASR